MVFVLILILEETFLGIYLCQCWLVVLFAERGSEQGVEGSGSPPRRGLADTLEDEAETQSHQHDTFSQRGDETLHSLSTSFALYGSNNALLSNITYHTHTHKR